MLSANQMNLCAVNGSQNNYYFHIRYDDMNWLTLVT
jgi:hypothetical protein